jgi:hypothetical protein
MTTSLPVTFLFRHFPSSSVPKELQADSLDDNSFTILRYLHCCADPRLLHDIESIVLKKTYTRILSRLLAPFPFVALPRHPLSSRHHASRVAHHRHSASRVTITKIWFHWLKPVAPFSIPPPIFCGRKSTMCRS